MSKPESQDPYSSWLMGVRQRAESSSPGPSAQPDEDLAESSGLERLVNGQDPLVTYIAAVDDPFSVVAERYRLLAARLEGLWKQPGFQKVGITSTLPGEGKSLTCINVACVLAKDFGRRVLVIDGDFRKPSLWQFVGKEPSTGLSDVITNRGGEDSAIRRLRYAHLGVLQVGRTPINSTRMWKSEAIKHLLAHYGGQYDYLIVDTPPVLSLVDTTLISDLMDGVVVVVRSGMTPKAMLQKALASLPRAKLVGTVFNGAKELHAASYYYHVR
jgi:capsular exopolysaccharide synthesis family protein